MPSCKHTRNSIGKIKSPNLSNFYATTRKKRVTIRWLLINYCGSAKPLTLNKHE